MGGAYCVGDGGVHCQDHPWPRDEEVLKRVYGNVYFLVSSLFWWKGSKTALTSMKNQGIFRAPQAF